VKRLNWQVKVGIGLVALSLALYGVHYLLFHDLHHIGIYFIGDVAFIPIEVLVVTIIIHQMLTAHEKRSMLRKLNMVIGSFFSEVGTPLLRLCSASDPAIDALRSGLTPTNDWTNDDFARAAPHLRKHGFSVEVDEEALAEMKSLLADRRGFLLNLLGNPNLLEHESFTDVLWAVFHLTDELVHRTDLTTIPATDLDHLAGDAKRAYGRLTGEWLSYMTHLQSDYPYLFSLAIRTNPFDIAASPVVR